MIEFLNQINSDHDLLFIFLRAIIIYIYAIILIRAGDKRYHIQTPFDFILVIIIGSILSRAINGSSTLLGAIVSSVAIIALHWLFAIFSFHNKKFGKLIKGEPTLLIKNGELHWKNLKNNQITQEDLREMCREKLHHDNLEQIKEARIERTGRISFIP